MTRIRLFLFVALFTFVVLACCLALHEYLYTFDPYRWAVPGEESDFSRHLFLQRAHLYRVVGIISFVLTLVSGGAARFSKRAQMKI